MKTTSRLFDQESVWQTALSGVESKENLEKACGLP